MKPFTVRCVGQIVQSPGATLVTELLARKKSLWESVFAIETEAAESLGNAYRQHDPQIAKLEALIFDQQRDLAFCLAGRANVLSRGNGKNSELDRQARRKALGNCAKDLHRAIARSKSILDALKNSAALELHDQITHIADCRRTRIEAACASVRLSKRDISEVTSSLAALFASSAASGQVPSLKSMPQRWDVRLMPADDADVRVVSRPRSDTTGGAHKTSLEINVTRLDGDESGIDLHFLTSNELNVALPDDWRPHVSLLYRGTATDPWSLDLHYSKTTMPDRVSAVLYRGTIISIRGGEFLRVATILTSAGMTHVDLDAHWFKSMALASKAYADLLALTATFADSFLARFRKSIFDLPDSDGFRTMAEFTTGAVNNPTQWMSMCLRHQNDGKPLGEAAHSMFLRYYAAAHRLLVAFESNQRNARTLRAAVLQKAIDFVVQSSRIVVLAEWGDLCGDSASGLSEESAAGAVTSIAVDVMASANPIRFIHDLRKAAKASLVQVLRVDNLALLGQVDLAAAPTIDGHRRSQLSGEDEILLLGALAQYGREYAAASAENGAWSSSKTEMAVGAQEGRH